MKSIAKQRGAIEIEGLETASPKSPRTASPIAPAKVIHARRELPWSRIAVALVAAAVLLVVAFMYRYEITSIPTNEPNLIRYILKDRWTGEVEAVWVTSA